MNKRVFNLAVLAIAAAPFLVSSCIEEEKPENYFTSIKTVSAIGLMPADETRLEFKIDSLNVEYRKNFKTAIMKTEEEEFAQYALEMFKDQFEQDVKKNIFDKIKATSLEISVGLYHIKDKKANNPIAILYFKY